MGDTWQDTVFLKLDKHNHSLTVRPSFRVIRRIRNRAAWKCAVV